MKIFCPVWGEKHISLLKNALVLSLKWPKNRKAIQGAEWIVTTESENELDQISKIIRTLGDHKVTDHFVPGISAPGVDTGQALITPLRETIKDCIEKNEPMLMATPDFIYADGTIDAFKKIGQDQGSCVAIAHMRILPSALKDINRLDESPYQIENDELMSVALNHAHDSWRKSPLNLFRGGIEWQNLGHGIYSVQHYMPSPFYVNFIDEDLTHFQEVNEGRPPGFGLWDHVWPTHLLKAGRLRFVGSSDAAMMVEITDAHKNVPPFNSKNDPRGFFRTHFHNEIQKQFVSVFRSK